LSFGRLDWRSSGWRQRSSRTWRCQRGSTSGTGSSRPRRPVNPSRRWLAVPRAWRTSGSTGSVQWLPPWTWN